MGLAVAVHILEEVLTGQILAAPDVETWDELLRDLSERNAFDPTSERGHARLTPFLATYGAKKLIHGHTPIPYVTDKTPDQINVHGFITVSGEKMSK